MHCYMLIAGIACGGGIAALLIIVGLVRVRDVNRGRVNKFNDSMHRSGMRTLWTGLALAAVVAAVALSITASRF